MTQVTENLRANEAGHVASYYAATAHGFRAREVLTDKLEVDVCVIGAGFTGISAALHLAERGYSVIVLEAERVGWGASGRNGGHVGIGQRRSQKELEQRLGNDKARMLWDFGLEAVQLVRDRIERHAIPCDPKQGILHLAAKRSDNDYLRGEADHLNAHYDYDRIRFVEQSEAREMVGSERYFAGMLDQGSLHLHPLNFVLGMAEAAEQAGVRIYESSRVRKIEHGESAVVSTAQGQVRCKFVVVGCNAYIENLLPSIARFIMPINNFVLATEPLDDNLARELIRDDVAVQDSLFVINYWKFSRDNRLLFGGGETYTRKFPADIPAFVRRYMLKVYPQLENTRIDYGWGGTLSITLKRMPVFGRVAPNVFYAHGYSGHGISIANFAGRLLSEAIAGQAERFDVMASVPAQAFPGGTLLRWPALVLGMLYYSLRDKL